jgi:type IV secretory pathway VirB9-like protein
MKYLLNTLLVMALLNGFVYAEEIPQGSDFDQRIRTAVFNPDEVYRVAAKIGYASYLQLWDDEKLESYFTGDAGGWDIASHGSVVAFKPLVKNPTTNFVIVSNKGRVYNLIFDLKTTVTKGHVIGLRFKYPDEEREKVILQKTATRDKYLAKKKDQDEEELKAVRLLANEYALKQDNAEEKREAAIAKLAKQQKLDRLENDLRRRALKQEKHEAKLTLLSLQEQLFSFDQTKKQAAFEERKRQRDEVMQIARQEQEVFDRAQARLDAKRLRLKRLKREAVKEEEEALQRQQRRLASARKKAAINPRQQAYKDDRYLAAGKGDLRPIEMFDNGRFTFMRFQEHIQLPAVFRVRNGKETLVNSSVKDGWIVIQNLSNEWKVRLDDEFICIRKSGRV